MAAGGWRHWRSGDVDAPPPPAPPAPPATPPTPSPPPGAIRSHSWTPPPPPAARAVADAGGHPQPQLDAAAAARDAARAVADAGGHPQPQLPGALDQVPRDGLHRPRDEGAALRAAAVQLSAQCARGGAVRTQRAWRVGRHAVRGHGVYTRCTPLCSTRLCTRAVLRRCATRRTSCRCRSALSEEKYSGVATTTFFAKLSGRKNGTHPARRHHTDRVCFLPRCVLSMRAHNVVPPAAIL